MSEINKRLKKVTNFREIKTGDLLLTVDHNHNESVDFVIGIDNGMIYTIDHNDDGEYARESVFTYITDYLHVYKID